MCGLLVSHVKCLSDRHQCPSISEDQTNMIVWRLQGQAGPKQQFSEIRFGLSKTSNTSYFPEPPTPRTAEQVEHNSPHRFEVSKTVTMSDHVKVILFCQCLFQSMSYFRIFQELSRDVIIFPYISTLEALMFISYFIIFPSDSGLCRGALIPGIAQVGRTSGETAGHHLRWWCQWRKSQSCVVKNAENNIKQQVTSFLHSPPMGGIETMENGMVDDIFLTTFYDVCCGRAYVDHQFVCFQWSHVNLKATLNIRQAAQDMFIQVA